MLLYKKVLLKTFGTSLVYKDTPNKLHSAYEQPRGLVGVTQCPEDHSLKSTQNTLSENELIDMGSRFFENRA